jgi:hypothetical protein
MTTVIPKIAQKIMFEFEHFVNMLTEIIPELKFSFKCVPTLITLGIYCCSTFIVGSKGNVSTRYIEHGQPHLKTGISYSIKSIFSTLTFNATQISLKTNPKESASTDSLLVTIVQS